MQSLKKLLKLVILQIITRNNISIILLKGVYINIPFRGNIIFVMYNDNLGQTVSNPSFDVDDAPEINADEMSEEELDRMLEETYGITDHNLNNGPEY